MHKGTSCRKVRFNEIGIGLCARESGHIQPVNGVRVVVNRTNEPAPLVARTFAEAIGYP